MPPPRFSVRDIQQNLQLTGYIIVVTTDVPCHLFMRWTLENPRTHKDPELKRGAFFPARVRFCFVEYEDNEQEEAGDTLTHTFIKLGWPECQTRYFYFWGTVAGESSPSESPLFEKHFKLPPMFGPYYAQIDALPWTQFLDRYVNGQTYQACHDSPVATQVLSSSTRFVSQHFTGVNKYRIRRKPLYFDTSIIPDEAFIYGAILSAYITGSDAYAKDVYLFDAPELHDPPVLADYGYIRTLTSPYISRLLEGEYDWSRRNFWKVNNYGLPTINKQGKTLWAFRTIDDINSVAPTTSMEGIWVDSDPEHLTVVYYLPV